ncbi:MAG: nicotinate (nicotinamide) nucleotide adenylyltransferase [Bacteroidetes bacterium]|nr:nicotinate (nicotinamide) nucleotide adenylyltransferase [Bacteroidota bacterium]
MNKIGLFGGTFNPPHLGHYYAAESVLKELGLEKIIFIPAFISPLKNEGEESFINERVKMLKIAIEDNTLFEISTFEAEKKDISFTIDTLKYFKKMNPEINYYLIIGVDSFNNLTKWKNYQKLNNYGKLVVMNRGDEKINENIISDYIKVTIPNIPISSSLIRDKIKNGESIEELVALKVRKYIIQKNLYL